MFLIHLLLLPIKIVLGLVRAVLGVAMGLVSFMAGHLIVLIILIGGFYLLVGGR